MAGAYDQEGQFGMLALVLGGAPAGGAFGRLDAASATLSQQLASERDHFVRNLHHANGGIGIQAFLTKQKPRYS